MHTIMKGIRLALLALIIPGEANALITGGEGNAPLRDPGWPAGAAAIFNHPGRIAWWEGPPFGGGQWHAECRGDAQALSAVLADFARLDARIKRLVIHDGTGHSFWLAPNREPEKLQAARIDWSFTVWQPENWERLRKLPADLNPTAQADPAPPAQIDVYTANLDWSRVKVPEGLEVIDRRLSAHGFSAEDGTVLEGRVTDLDTGRPIAATVLLERIEPQPQGGYRHTEAARAQADDQGRWALKHVPAGWYRVAAEEEGYVPRVAGYARLDDQPRWHPFDCALARPAAVAGRVTDDAGAPLEGVDVRLDNVQAATGGRYESPASYTTKTDAEGRFRFEQVPVGKASVWVHKPGYCRPGLGPAITTPAQDVALQMTRSASVRVTVDFAGKPRPEGYIVSMEPEGGSVVGSYGGSGNINAENRLTFPNVPPGRYKIHGRPNPGSDAEQTEDITLDLKGGDAAEITLEAR